MFYFLLRHLIASIWSMHLLSPSPNPEQPVHRSTLRGPLGSYPLGPLLLDFFRVVLKEAFHCSTTASQSVPWSLHFFRSGDGPSRADRGRWPLPFLFTVHWRSMPWGLDLPVTLTLGTLRGTGSCFHSNWAARFWVQYEEVGQKWVYFRSLGSVKHFYISWYSLMYYLSTSFHVHIICFGLFFFFLVFFSLLTVR